MEKYTPMLSKIKYSFSCAPKSVNPEIPCAWQGVVKEIWIRDHEENFKNEEKLKGMHF